MLGNHSPHVLVDTMLYLIRLNFTLRSGEAHYLLRHFPYLTPWRILSTIAGIAMYLLDIINCQKQCLATLKITPYKLLPLLQCMMHNLMRLPYCSLLGIEVWMGCAHTRHPLKSFISYYKPKWQAKQGVDKRKRCTNQWAKGKCSTVVS